MKCILCDEEIEFLPFEGSGSSRNWCGTDCSLRGVATYEYEKYIVPLYEVIEKLKQKLAGTEKKDTVDETYDEIHNTFTVSELSVHTEHCCIEHGCKYGKEYTCEVWLGYAKQSHICENCEWGSGYFPEVSIKEIESRRKEAEKHCE